MKIRTEQYPAWGKNVVKINFDNTCLMNGFELDFYKNKINSKRIKSAIENIAIYLDSKGLNKWLPIHDNKVSQELAEIFVLNSFFDEDKFMSKSKSKLITEAKMMADAIIKEYKALHKVGAGIGDKLLIQSYSMRDLGFYSLHLNPERVPREEDNYVLPFFREEVEE